MDNLSEYLGTIALAAGALGTASYGIVDGLKFITWVELSGFECLFSIRDERGGRLWLTRQKAGLSPLLPALKLAYGNDVMEVLRAQYRNGRTKGDLPRTLRQGVRIGMGMMSREEIVRLVLALGIAKDTAELAADALVLSRRMRPPAAGQPGSIPPVTISDEQRAALARLETTIDARIDAALCLAETQFVTQTRLYAMFVALIIAFGVGLHMGQDPVVCLLVGLLAVPLAPIAKDLASALQSAVKVFRAR